jgi:cell division protein FtsL
MKRPRRIHRPNRVGVAFEPRAFAIAVAIYAAIAATGISIASLSQAVRNLHIDLESTQREQDALLAEYSRLLIERSMLASYQNVDQVAERKLAMTFPEVVERMP